MTTVYDFQFQVRVWRDLQSDKWLATSQHIPMCITASDRDQLEQRIHLAIKVFNDYIEKRMAGRDLGDYLHSRGIQFEVGEEDGGEDSITLMAEPVLVGAGLG